MLLALVAASGCGSFTPAGPRPGGIDTAIPRMPPDFAISMSIHLPALPDGAGSRPPAWKRPAWFLVEPDGRLRYLAGTRTESTPLPPIARQLTSAEVNELWSTVRAAGLTKGSTSVLGGAGSSASARPGARDLPSGAPTRPTAIVYVAGEGQRRSYEIDLSADDAAALGARDLASRLAQLAGAN